MSVHERNFLSILFSRMKASREMDERRYAFSLSKLKEEIPVNV
jgi:hypothetical protein